MPYEPSPTDTPYGRLGGEATVRAIVEHFYDAMTELEPALARLHPCDERGYVAQASRDRFALFFIGWLGGPEDYITLHGHPRLRRRHAEVPVNDAMIAAWLRCMKHAFAACGVADEVREVLEPRLEEVATHLRNRDG